MLETRICIADKICRFIPHTNAAHWPNVVLALAHLLQRWPNIKRTLEFNGHWLVGGLYIVRLVCLLIVHTTGTSWSNGASCIYSAGACVIPWNSLVKICHLYKNVQNRPQNKNKFDGVRKWVSKPSYQAKFKMAALKSQKLTYLHQ